MSTKPSRKELTHERILDSAARALRLHGHQGVGVADVMKDAGLTHGGFYAHFESREAMLAEAVARAGKDRIQAVREDMAERRANGATPLQALIEAYLSEEHLSAVDTGCVVAALASEIPRQPDELREATCDRVRQFIAGVQRALPPGAAPDSAVVIVSTLLGALQLARALGANKKGKAILKTCAETLIAQYDHPAQAVSSN